MPKTKYSFTFRPIRKTSTSMGHPSRPMLYEPGELRMAIVSTMYMGLFDPTDEDNREDKKPRHWQDFIVVFVVLGMVLIYLLLEWLVF